MISAVGALAGIYIVFETFRKAENSTQQAECAVVAMAFAALPYFLARSAGEILHKR